MRYKVKNDIRDAGTVQGYNHPLLQRTSHQQEIEINPIDMFRLGNMQNKHLLEQTDFESLVNYTDTRTDSDTVTVYLNGFQMVAWYDANSKYGYVDPDPNNS